MAELVASIPDLAVFGEHPVHGPLRAQVAALVEQGGVHLGRRGVAEPVRAQHLEHARLLLLGQGPGRAGPGLDEARRPAGAPRPAPAVRRGPGHPQHPGCDGGPDVRGHLLHGSHHRSLSFSSLAGSSEIPSSSETFPWTSMIFSAWPKRRRRRSLSVRSRVISLSFGSGRERPRGRPRATRAPASRWRRQSTRWEEYSPSRRSSAPISPGSVAASISFRMASLYSAVNRRRVGRSGTSGSGGAMDPWSPL